MPQPAVRLPEVTRHALALARTVTIGIRAWNLYPLDHPALGLAIERLVKAIGAATAKGPLMLAVTPQTLMVDGMALDDGPTDGADVLIAECAKVLHDLDLLQLSFVAPATDQLVRDLLETLTIDRTDRRARGGPAAIWEATGHAAVIIEQIDYQELLQREDEPGPARRDSLWQSIVRSIVGGRRTFTEAEQQRLLKISRDSWAIGELADDCRAAFCTPEGSPLVTTQAATVLAVYRHIASTVGVLEPDRAPEVMGHFATTTSALDPALAVGVMTMEDARDEPLPIMAAMKQKFDDQQIAMLLARALAKTGEATNRLSQMLDTLAPDEERRKRVLRLADHMLSDRDFGATKAISDIRASLEQMMLQYDESQFVSASYRDSMDHAAGRAAELAARDLPPELPEWLGTLTQVSVRQLSAQLMIDLLLIETDRERAAEITKDMTAFAVDLLPAGAYGEAQRIVEALVAFHRKTPPLARDAARRAIDDIGRSSELADAAGMLGELSTGDAATISNLCRAIGPPAVPALVAALTEDERSLQTARVVALLVSLGRDAIPAIGQGLDSQPPFAQRLLARVLGTLGTVAAVPPLQTLLRRKEPETLKAVVTALAGIDDPAAARALHTVLRAVSGAARASVVEALVGVRDPRVVPMLARILDESQPLGGDFDLVLHSLDAIATFKDDRAVRPVSAIARQRRLLAWRRTRRLRERATGTLVSIGTTAAASALDLLQQHGDFQLRRIVRASRAGRPA